MRIPENKHPSTYHNPSSMKHGSDETKGVSQQVMKGIEENTKNLQKGSHQYQLGATTKGAKSAGAIAKRFF